MYGTVVTIENARFGVMCDNGVWMPGVPIEQVRSQLASQTLMCAGSVRHCAWSLRILCSMRRILSADVLVFLHVVTVCVYAKKSTVHAVSFGLRTSAFSLCICIAPFLIIFALATHAPMPLSSNFRRAQVRSVRGLPRGGSRGGRHGFELQDFMFERGIDGRSLEHQALLTGGRPQADLRRRYSCFELGDINRDGYTAPKNRLDVSRDDTSLPPLPVTAPSPTAMTPTTIQMEFTFASVPAGEMHKVKTGVQLKALLDAASGNLAGILFVDASARPPAGQSWPRHIHSASTMVKVSPSESESCAVPRNRHSVHACKLTLTHTHVYIHTQIICTYTHMHTHGHACSHIEICRLTPHFPSPAGSCCSFWGVVLHPCSVRYHAGVLAAVRHHQDKGRFPAYFRRFARWCGGACKLTLNLSAL
jgi:hypothetical protein